MKVVRLGRVKDTKNWVKFMTADPEAPIRDVYVAREFAKDALTIEITVDVIEEVRK